MDIRIDGQDFAATEAIVSYLSDAGKQLFEQMFGAAAVSVNMPKSRSIDFARYCKQRGMTVECA